jgi:fructose-bisphosphate aldolase class I
MYEKVRSANGFIAALDQSGGSTPKALRLYGIEESEYSTGAGIDEGQMFDLMHAMRSRIIASPVFTGERILGAILFEMTMERQVEGKGAAEYLWLEKQIVPFVKVDKGLADESDDAQLMKPMPELAGLLERSKSHGVFGTKMRSVIKQANPTGVDAIVDQQFDVAEEILAAGLMPIVEPEVDIKSATKAEAEQLLKTAILRRLERLGGDQQVMLKLTIPSDDNFYADLIDHPKVLRVVALSGGYTREDANERLMRNHRLIASFSRALTEGLSAKQSDEEFNRTLGEAIASIYAASAS